jgi:hypothetical protein
MSNSATRLAFPLTLLVFAVYVALLPWTGQVWLRTGDEPHYLIAADSLVRDGDLDLRNNYDAQVYLDWYPAANLDRQVQTRADGAQFLIHTYGLPFLIAPAYWLGGARGVAYFMAGLGALLAGQLYLLCYKVTRDWRASVLGSLAVALASPLVWYVYLLYPELAGALCVTVAVRALISRSDNALDRRGVPVNAGTTGWGEPVAFGLALAALPWLSARFIPVMITLALLGVWRVLRGRRLRVRRGDDLEARLRGAARAGAAPARWRLPRAAEPRAADFDWIGGGRVGGRRPLLWHGVGLLLPALSLGGLALFNAVLYGQAAPTASYGLDLAPAAASWPVVLQFLRGILGWLMDHQRGLLVAGPIYLVAFIGLGQWLWQRSWGASVVALTFLTALLSTAFLGGYWVGIEPAARYLVYVLPPLGAGLAFAWAHRRGPWVAALLVSTLAMSAWIAAQVFAEPLLAQTHDLLGERAAWLVPYLPALGRVTYLTPGAAGTLAVPVADPPVDPAAASLWRVPAGQPGTAFQENAIADFSFGWYQLQISLAATPAPPDAPVARVLFQAGDGTPVVNAVLYGRDFPAGGRPRTFTFPLYNPVYNQWEQPPALSIFTTGQAELTLGQIALPPETFHSLILPALWLAALALVGLLVGSRFNARPSTPTVPGWLAGRGVRLASAALVLGVGYWSLRPLARNYPAAELRHFVGQLAPDSNAAGGQVISAADDAETPGVLASTRPEFFPGGHYLWRLSLKAGQEPPEAILATAKVIWSRQPIASALVAVTASAVPADGRFHTIDVEFDNPVRQALVFELDTAGAGPLATQAFEVRPLP